MISSIFFFMRPRQSLNMVRGWLELPSYDFRWRTMTPVPLVTETPSKAFCLVSPDATMVIYDASLYDGAEGAVECFWSGSAWLVRSAQDSEGVRSEGTPTPTLSPIRTGP